MERVGLGFGPGLKKPAGKITGLGRPNSTIRPKFQAQARLVSAKSRRASGLGPGFFLKTPICKAQEHPVTSIRPKSEAQARPLVSPVVPKPGNFGSGRSG